MNYCFYDLESDGLLDTVSKIHVLSYTITDKDFNILESDNLINYTDIKKLFERDLIFIGHNIVTYDIPVVEKLLDIKCDKRLVDTLALSHYLYPLLPKHGLESWGEFFGIPKPVIEEGEWLGPLENETQEKFMAKMTNRCEEDVKITISLYKKQVKYLKEIYSDRDFIGIEDYLVFKRSCLREQEEETTLIDLKKAKKHKRILSEMKEEKVSALASEMPRNIKFVEKSIPAKMYKKDGNFSVAGLKWIDLLKENNLPLDYEGSVLVKSIDEEGNPNSSTQIKDWLFSLGWEPDVFVSRMNTKGQIKEVPQIYEYSKLTDSVRLLLRVEPSLKHLNQLTLINHRLGVFKGFIKNSDAQGRTVAGASGFTNTLRFKHVNPIVNLVKPSKWYGKEIRSCIIAPENTMICGCDMVSLEDTTKQHYMSFFDPEYVTEMRVPGFDAHTDIAVLADIMTKEEEERWKELKNKKDLSEEENNELTELEDKRYNGKQINFSGIYGAGPPKISAALGCTLEFAQALHLTYWERNKAVKQVAASCKVKKIGDQMWVFNPISKFWYSLREKKDIFSTLNQGTGVYCFDTFLYFIRHQGVKVFLQYHDEIATIVKDENKEEIKRKLKIAIDETNKLLKLNVPLGIDYKFADNYADAH